MKKLRSKFSFKNIKNIFLRRKNKLSANPMNPSETPSRAQQRFNEFEKEGIQLRSKMVNALRDQDKSGLPLYSVTLPTTQKELDRYKSQLISKAKSSGQIVKRRGKGQLDRIMRSKTADQSVYWRVHKMIDGIMKYPPGDIKENADVVARRGHLKESVKDKNSELENLVNMRNNLGKYIKTIESNIDIVEETLEAHHVDGIKSFQQNLNRFITNQTRDILGKGADETIGDVDIQKAIDSSRGQGEQREVIYTSAKEPYNTADVNIKNISDENYQNVDAVSKENISEDNYQNIGDVSKENISEDNYQNIGDVSKENISEDNYQNIGDVSKENISEENYQNVGDVRKENISEGNYQNVGDVRKENISEDNYQNVDAVSKENISEDNYQNIGNELPVIKAHSDEDNPSELVEHLRKHFTEMRHSFNDPVGDEAAYTVTAWGDVNQKIQLSDDSVNMLPQNDDGVNDVVSAMLALQANDTSLKVELSGNADMMQLKCLNGCIDQGVKVSGDLDPLKYEKLFQEKNGDPKNVEFKSKDGKMNSMSFDQFNKKLEGFKNEQKQQQEKGQKMESP